MVDEPNALSERIARWVDNDSITDAINELRTRSFKAMTEKFPTGVNDGVMVRLLMAGMEAQIAFMRDMLIEVLATQHGWTETETQEQHVFSVLVFEFIREEAKYLLLEMMENT